MIRQKVSSQPENLDQIIHLNIDAIYWYLFQLIVRLNSDFDCSSSFELSSLGRVATGM